MFGTLIKFSGCDACTLKKEWNFLDHPRMPVSYPRKQSEVRVLVIGEAPGENEDKQGVPFVGLTGQFLRECIPSQWRDKLYWTNSARCRPPKNRTPEVQELLCCSKYLEEDLVKIQPHVILGVGGVPLSYFLPEHNITQMRGAPFPVIMNNGFSCWYYPVFHPSYVIQSGGKDEKENAIVPTFKSDIRRLFDKIDFYSQRPVIESLPENIHFPKTKDEAWHLFNSLVRDPAIDIETFKKKPYLRDARILTASFSDGYTTFAFPVGWPGIIDNWGEEFLIEAIQKRKWIAHSAPFELVWLWYKTQNPRMKFEDTMAIGRYYHERYGILSLEDQCRIHLGRNFKTGFQDQDGDSKRLLEYPLETALTYNALDSYPTALLYYKNLLPPGQEANYRRTLDTIRSTVAMELMGLPVDIKASVAMKQKLSVEMDEYESQAKEIKEVISYEKREGKKFSISAPLDVAEVLANYCGFKLPTTEKSKQLSTDAGDLEKFAGEHPLVDLTLAWREVSKLLSTYVLPILKGELLGIDGLIHAAYTVVLTKTGRLSSEDPNIQNYPKRKHSEIRAQIVVPPGMIMAAYDYGQLEARTLVMASGDKRFKKAMLLKEDLHSKWRDRIIQVHPPYLDRLRSKTGETELEKILKAGRDIIKSDFVFASLYGSVVESVAKRTMLPLDVVRKVQGELWEEYSEAKLWINESFKEYQQTGKVVTLTDRIRDTVCPGNEPINTVIQGTAADIVLEAQNALFYLAMELNDPCYVPRVNIHDDLIFFLPDNDELLDTYIPKIGQEIVKVRFPFINVPLTTECRVGYDWASLEKVTLFAGQYYDNGVLVN